MCTASGVKKFYFQVFLYVCYKHFIATFEFHFGAITYLLYFGSHPVGWQCAVARRMSNKTAIHRALNKHTNLKEDFNIQINRQISTGEA